MNLDGGQLARAMMSIHQAELEQDARYPGNDLSERIERRIVIGRPRHRALCRVGELLVAIGQRLQRYGLPQHRALEGDVTRVEGTGTYHLYSQ